MTPTTHYPCLTVHEAGGSAGGGPCALGASYFARDDRARHAHLCRQCWRRLTLSEQELYEERDHDESTP
jgi:hypothetical protein